ncbi:unnamed protein product [Notodromas monacha]|uniref:Oxysterol-binding protein n=1 Tax=Notodromas monacha TaxID=399045 RepID=A0A7R9GAZ2_9CRUS|nr:unnamed protein product [Notodromas monacha]CAG0914541.1 unnamed protein product [Notodromas monacha]
MLQRIAESLEYGYLLDKADQADDAILRMELLMAFCVSCLSSSKDRSLKPFNPVLGETFQLETPDSRCIAEQISHHPPISAFHAQGKQFTVYCNLQPRVVFWGMSLEVDPNSNHVITLKRHNEHYFWTGVPIIIKSILFGTPHLEYDGVLEIRKHNSTLRGILDFAAGNRAKSSDVERTRVVGTIFDGERKLRNLKGFWADHLMSTSATGPDFRRASAGANSGGFHRLRNPADEQVNKRRSNHQKVRSSGSSAANKTNRQKSQANSTLKIDKCDPGDSQNDRLLFKMTERPPKSSDYFSFSYFALTLNQLRREPGSDICATDSRFRPDLRLFEEGKEQQSEEARDRLRQRAHENRNKNNTTTTAANEGTTSTSHHPHKPRFLKFDSTLTGLTFWFLYLLTSTNIIQ